MIEKILTKIQEYDTIIIHRHERPDGDALGSQVGLKESLQESFPNKKVFIVGDTNEKFSFFGNMDNIDDDIYHKALIIVLDTAEAHLISDKRFSTGNFIIKIDHHISKNGFGDICYVDTTFESCSGLVADLIFSLNLKLTDKGAKALFTGIVTDTGRFRYDSTNQRTFEIVANLMKYNLNISEIYDNLYIEDLSTLKLRAHFILNFQVTEHNVAYMKNTHEDLKKFNVDFFTVSRGMVNVMCGIKDIFIWVNFTEDETSGLIIAEIRSSKYNINQVAVKYGGGGHKLASGASLNSWDEVNQMLIDLDNLAKENL